MGKILRVNSKIDSKSSAVQNTETYMYFNFRNYTNWAPNEPNEYGGYAEDCGHFLKLNHGLWNDMPCSYKLPYICERYSSEDYKNIKAIPTVQEYSHENMLHFLAILIALSAFLKYCTAASSKFTY